MAKVCGGRRYAEATQDMLCGCVAMRDNARRARAVVRSLRTRSGDAAPMRCHREYCVQFIVFHFISFHCISFHYLKDSLEGV